MILLLLMLQTRKLASSPKATGSLRLSGGCGPAAQHLPWTPAHPSTRSSHVPATSPLLVTGGCHGTHAACGTQRRKGLAPSTCASYQGGQSFPEAFLWASLCDLLLQIGRQAPLTGGRRLWRACVAWEDRLPRVPPWKAGSVVWWVSQLGFSKGHVLLFPNVFETNRGIQTRV